MRKRQIIEMENAMNVVDNVIDRIKNLKEFTVVRDVDSFPLNGVIPFDLKHTVGGPLEITVIAETQEEADRRADKWLAMED
jgi:hypothetical protein